MSSFMSLVCNEWLKQFRKKSFFIAFIILAAIAVGVAIVINQTSSLKEVLGFAEYLDLMLGLGGLGGVYVLLGIIGTASIVSSEHQLGTIKFLLIRAHSRSKILASKYVMLIIYLVLLMVVTAVISIIAGLILLDRSNFTWDLVMKNMASTFVNALVYCTITFMFSVITRSTGATIGIGMFVNFCEGIFQMLLSKYSWAKFTLFFNTNLSVYIGGGEPLEGMSLSFSFMLIAIYMVLFLTISFVVYNKRDI